MSQQKGVRKIGGITGYRISVLRDIAAKAHIVTTISRARELGPLVDRVMDLAFQAIQVSGDEVKSQKVYFEAKKFLFPGSIRIVPGRVRGKKGPGPNTRVSVNEAEVKRLLGDLGSQFSSYEGCYTRIIKPGTRSRDNAEMAIVELVGITSEGAAKAIAAGTGERPMTWTAYKKRPEHLLEDLSDEEVISLAHSQMSDDRQSELNELLAKQRENELSKGDAERLRYLMELHSEGLLKKAEAMAAAAKRGLDFGSRPHESRTDMIVEPR